MMRGQARYGDVVRFRFGPYPALLVSSPSGIGRVARRDYGCALPSLALAQEQALSNQRRQATQRAP
jgi:hypothetical protein